jgi:hypothetical protein
VESKDIRIGPLHVHRKEQWDLDCWPLVCVHWRYDGGNGNKRIFCLWRWGIQVRPIMVTSRALHIGRRVWRWRAAA